MCKRNIPDLLDELKEEIKKNGEDGDAAASSERGKQESGKFSFCFGEKKRTAGYKPSLSYFFLSLGRVELAYIWLGRVVPSSKVFWK